MNLKQKLALLRSLELSAELLEAWWMADEVQEDHSPERKAKLADALDGLLAQRPLLEELAREFRQ